jgi:hypothetical protein
MQGETQLLHPLFETGLRGFTLHVKHFDFCLNVFVGSLKWCKQVFFFFFFLAEELLPIFHI